MSNSDALPSSRSEAKMNESARFFTGLPCERSGHIAQRLTSSGNCIECSIEKKRIYRAHEREKVNAANRGYRQRNGDAVRAREAAQRKRNAERCAANKRRYLDRFPERHAAREAKRRAAVQSRTPSWADIDAIRKVYETAARMSDETGMQHDVDHVYPLRGRLVSGLHVLENLQVLPFLENRSKGNRAPREEQ